jgi:hypothetical protein
LAVSWELLWERWFAPGLDPGAVPKGLADRFSGAEEAFPVEDFPVEDFPAGVAVFLAAEAVSEEGAVPAAGS